VGCALPGWVRVGWGDTQTLDDMKPADSPSTSYLPLKISPTLGLDCSVASATTPPLPDRPRHAAPVAVAAARRPGGRPSALHAVTRDQLPTNWIPFRNTEPPTLAADEFAVDNGAPNDVVQLRAYAWGKRGSDWTRNGRWLVRFDDRFDAAGGLRSSAVTASLWAHDMEALEAIGTGSYGQSSWGGFLDPSGRSLLASACRGQMCSLYSVGEGQPVTPIRAAGGQAGVFLRPFPGGALRIGETWFFISQTSSYDGVALFRADLGVARQIGTYHRPTQRSGYDPPRLVRRAFGGGVGMLIGGAPEPGERSGSWYVIPVDPETGTLGEAVSLVRRDFTGTSLPRCAAEQDGWVFDLSVMPPDLIPNIEIDNARAGLDGLEMRVRVDPGRACVEGFGARSGPFYGIAAQGAQGAQKPLTSPPGKKGGGDEGTVPLSVTEKATGRRWGLTCKIKKR
jgi:hypothetical protein